MKNCPNSSNKCKHNLSAEGVKVDRKKTSPWQSSSIQNIVIKYFFSYLFFWSNFSKLITVLYLHLWWSQRRIKEESKKNKIQRRITRISCSKMAPQWRCQPETTVKLLSGRLCSIHSIGRPSANNFFLGIKTILTIFFWSSCYFWVKYIGVLRDTARAPKPTS